jgi:hypothetical protein
VSSWNVDRLLRQHACRHVRFAAPVTAKYTSSSRSYRGERERYALGWRTAAGEIITVFTRDLLVTRGPLPVTRTIVSNLVR